MNLTYKRQKTACKRPIYEGFGSVSADKKNRGYPHCSSGGSALCIAGSLCTRLSLPSMYLSLNQCRNEPKSVIVGRVLLKRKTQNKKHTSTMCSQMSVVSLLKCLLAKLKMQSPTAERLKVSTATCSQQCRRGRNIITATDSNSNTAVSYELVSAN